MSATSILINVGAKTDTAVRGLADVEKALQAQEKATSRSGAAIKKMAVPAAAAFAAVSAAAIGFAKAAADDAAGAERMANNLAKSAGATRTQVDATEDWISAQGRALGVADDQLRPAIERLARSTGDLGEAQELAAISMDIAAATGQDVEKVAGAVAKAYDGNTGALKKMGIEVGKTDDLVGALGRQFSGAAGKQAETAAGKMARFQLAMSETGEALGGILLPAMEALMPLLAGFADWASSNTTTIAVIGGVIGTLAAVVLVANAAMSAWAAITAVWSAVTAVATGIGAAFGAVMAVITAPITLIVLAVLALIAVVVLLWKNWDTITKALGKAWTWLKDKAVAIFTAVAAFLTRVWQGIKDKVTAVWNGIKTWLAGVWNGIRNTAVAAFNALKSKLAEVWTNIKTTVSDKIKGLIDYVKGLPGKILSAIGNLNGLLYDTGKDLIQGLINGIKSMIGGIGNLIKNALPDIPGIGSPFSVPVSPQAAAFMAGPRAAPKTTPAPAKQERAVLVTEEQVYRAVSQLLLRGAARNGRVVMVG